MPDPAYTVFPSDVAVHGDRLVIGAARQLPPPEGGWFNSAFLYERAVNGSCNVVAILFDAPEQSHSHFPPRVAIEGDVLAVATYFELRVFERSSGGWIQTAYLHPPAGSKIASDIEIENGTILAMEWLTAGSRSRPARGPSR